ncbi:hypothetical protein RFI_26172, partial [Reticulomyxa filosa]
TVRRDLPLFKPEQVIEQIVPLAFQLCDDRMADVRYAAVIPIAELINYFEKKGTQEQFEDVIAKCDSIHAARTYSKRLLEKKNNNIKHNTTRHNTNPPLRYVKLCEACFTRISPTIFNERFLPKLVAYGDDRISNVRFALARLLSTELVKKEAIVTRDDVRVCIARLKNDTEDVEVKRFFSTPAEIEIFLQEQQAALEEAASTHAEMENFESQMESSSEEDERSETRMKIQVTGTGGTHQNQSSADVEMEFNAMKNQRKQEYERELEREREREQANENV